MRGEWKRKLPGDLDGWKEHRQVKGSYPSLLVSNFLTMMLGILITCPILSPLVPVILPHQDALPVLKSSSLVSFIDLFLSSCRHVLSLHPQPSALPYELFPCKEIHLHRLISSSIWVMCHKVQCTPENKCYVYQPLFHLFCPIFCSWFLCLDVFTSKQMPSRASFQILPVL